MTTLLTDEPMDVGDDLDSTARPKSKKKTKAPSSALSSKPSRPVQHSATESAKLAMTLQEPQLLDKMESVAYRLTSQADERKKHMNSRYCPCHPVPFIFSAAAAAVAACHG